MAIHSDSNFPLCVNDQADVIQIFIELMREGDYSRREFEPAASEESLEPRSNSNDL